MLLLLFFFAFLKLDIIYVLIYFIYLNNTICIISPRYPKEQKRKGKKIKKYRTNKK